jgi:hypothetical protein
MAAITPKRLAYPLAVAVMIGGAVATYQAKHDAVEAAASVAELRHRIDQERMAISLLKAEWSELTQPARLQDLLGRYPEVLDLGPYGVERMIRLGDIPFPPAEDPDLIGAFLAEDG